MRRWPPLEKTLNAYDPSVVGFQSLIAGASGIILEVRTLIAASNGEAGTAEFTSNGTGFKSLAVPQSGTVECQIPNGYELLLGSGLEVLTSTDMAITVWYTTVDERSPVTKVAARTNTYNAYLAQKAANQQAIRVPNRFGGQVEG